MAKAKTTDKKLNVLYTVAPHGADPESFTIVLVDPEGTRDVFPTQAEAQRLCDLLNAGYELFKTGHKSDGLDKPAKVGKKKAK